jgi:glycosyltransferase involved in cell wall biosynthesis
VAKAAGARRRIAFIKRGLFSYSNVRTLEQLRAQFSTHEIEVIDVSSDLLQRRPWVPLLAALAAFGCYGRRLLTRRQSLRAVFFRTPFAFHATRRLIRARLAPCAAEYAFTFQTQSLFDAHLPGVPHFVYTDHTHLANLRYPSFERSLLAKPEWITCERTIYENATLTFVMGGHVARSLVEDYGLPAARTATVFAGSNIDPAPVALDNADFTNRTILFIGIDWERKGGPVLLEAFAQLARRVPEARLIIAGSTPRTDDPRIDVRGKIPRDEVKSLLRRASVLCLPTRMEPFGIAPIEAHHHGLPVVATRLGAIPDMVLDGESGHLVPPDDPAALAAALEDLLLDPAKARRFGQRGRVHVAEHFTWEATGRKIATAIRQIVPG